MHTHTDENCSKNTAKKDANTNEKPSDNTTEKDEDFEMKLGQNEQLVAEKESYKTKSLKTFLGLNFLQFLVFFRYFFKL